MPAAYYVETGALLKRYRREPGSAVVDELLEARRPDELLLTSQWTLVECKAVATRLLKGRELRRSQYERLIARLFEDLASYGVRVLPIEASLLAEALDLYPQFSLRAPDALHLLSAVRFQRTFEPASFYLVTGDHEIGDAARAHGIEVIDPEAASALEGLRRST